MDVISEDNPVKIKKIKKRRNYKRFSYDEDYNEEVVESFRFPFLNLYIR